MATRKPAVAKALARYHDDPDNWRRIPEFGVLPEDVGFVGFWGELLYPGAPDVAARMVARALLAAARAQARRVFKTMAQHQKALEKAWERGLSGTTDEMPEYAKIELEALRYEMVVGDLGSLFEGIGSSHKGPRTPAKMLEELADVARWLEGGVDHVLERVQAGASRGGLHSAETRRAKAVDAEAVVRGAKSLGWPNKNWGIQSRLATRFNCDSSRIGQILRKAIENGE